MICTCETKLCQRKTCRRFRPDTYLEDGRHKIQLSIPKDTMAIAEPKRFCQASAWQSDRERRTSDNGLDAPNGNCCDRDQGNTDTGDDSCDTRYDHTVRD